MTTLKQQFLAHIRASGLNLTDEHVAQMERKVLPMSVKQFEALHSQIIAVIRKHKWDSFTLALELRKLFQ